MTDGRNETGGDDLESSEVKGRKVKKRGWWKGRSEGGKRE